MSGGCPSRLQSVWEQRGGLLAPCRARPSPGWCGFSARLKPQHRGRACPGRHLCLRNTGQGVGSGHPPWLEGEVLVVADPVLGPPGRLGGWGTQGVQASRARPCPGPQPFTPRLSSILSPVRLPSSGCGRRSRAEPGGGSRLASQVPPHTLLLGAHPAGRDRISPRPTWKQRRLQTLRPQLKLSMGSKEAGGAHQRLGSR